MGKPVSSPVCVRVLGGFELSGTGGADLTLPGRKLRALAALLALPPSLGWSREQLTALLWGDRDDELARGSLRQALAELRRVLGESALLADRETVALDPAAVQVDAAEFAALTKNGAWAEAAALYRGDLLDGVSLPDGAFSEWLLVERTHLHDLAVRALASLLETQSGEAALATAQRLIHLDPAREETHRALMCLHAAHGDRAAALRQYQLCRDHLQREFGVKPEPETERLFRDIRASTRQPSASVDDRPSPSIAAPDPAHHQSARGGAPQSRRWGWVAGTVALVVGIAVIGWWRPWDTSSITVTPAGPPSLAVLPFDNLSDDPQQVYFADGITDDLMTDLSRVQGLTVIGRHSTFAYRGRQTDVREVARELGVRYVIDGSMRRAGDQVRINVQLIDAATGGQQWAERYDGSLSDIFALQDQVAGAVVNAMALRLTAGEESALARQETALPEAYDAFLQGWEFYRRATPNDLLNAIPHFEQAIELDPAYGRAHAALAMIYFQAYDQAWAGMLDISANDAYRRARDHLTVAKTHPTSMSHQVAGNMSRERGWYEDALQEFDAAMALDPNDSWTHAYAAYALVWAGRPAEAEMRIGEAMRLDPHPPALFVFYRGLTQFSLERFAAAATDFEAAHRRDPDHTWSALYLAASYGLSDRKQEGSAMLAVHDAAAVRRGGIPFVIDQLIWKTTAVHPPETHRLIAGLLRVGAPKWYADPRFDAHKLRPADIDQLFFGHRLHGRRFESGVEYGASVTADGTAIMFGEWGVGSGVAQLEGDGLCFVWTSGTTNCATIFRNPGGTKEKENEFIWFSHQRGEYAFSQVD
jgi:adenylate cyclase